MCYWAIPPHHQLAKMGWYIKLWEFWWSIVARRYILLTNYPYFEWGLVTSFCPFPFPFFFFAFISIYTTKGSARVGYLFVWYAFGYAFFRNGFIELYFCCAHSHSLLFFYSFMDGRRTWCITGYLWNDLWFIIQWRSSSMLHKTRNLHDKRKKKGEKTNTIQ